MTDEEQLIAACAAFQASGDNFAALVREGVGIVGAYALATELEVAPSTVRRWAAGHSAPLPLMSVEVIKTLARLVVAQLCTMCQHGDDRHMDLAPRCRCGSCMERSACTADGCTCTGYTPPGA